MGAFSFFVGDLRFQVPFVLVFGERDGTPNTQSKQIRVR